MAELLRADNTVTVTVTSGPWYSGQMKQAADGRVGIVSSCRPLETGELATLQIKGVVRIVAGANLDEGDVGAVHLVNQNLVAADAEGAVNAGIVLKDVLSAAYAEIDLNEFPYVTPAE